MDLKAQPTDGPKIWRALAWAALFSMVAALSAVSTASHAAPVKDIQILQGECGAQSHTAEGGVNDDLTKRQSRFFCDSAVISFFDEQNRHILIQFSEKHSNHQRIIGYGGTMEADGKILDVDHIYLEPSKALPAQGGACKLFFAQRHMTDIVCGAQVIEGQQKTVAIVAFKAAPGQ